MYCRYAKTSIWDPKQCPLNGGEFYCVLFRERSLSEVPLYSKICFVLYYLLGTFTAACALHQANYYVLEPLTLYTFVFRLSQLFFYYT